MIDILPQTPINERLIDKIAKLLRLSASPNQHEAELALSKAKQLAVENDIDLASVSDTNSKEETYEKDTISCGKRKPVTGRFVSWIVQKHFNTYLIYSGSRWEGQRINFIGKSKDIQIAIYVFNYLNQTFMSLWHNYQKDTNCSVTSRGSYFFGLYQGLNQKLEQVRLESERNKFSALEQEKGNEASAEIKNHYAVMIINNSTKLAAAVKDFYPKLRTVSNARLNISNYDALLQGKEDGRKIEIRPSLGVRANHLCGFSS